MEKFWKAVDNLRGQEHVNELLYYNIEGEKLFIHLAKNDAIPLHKKRSVFKDGLSKLADDIEGKKKRELEDIKFIIAGSWILKIKPRLGEDLGFKVYKDPSDEKNIEEMRRDGITSMQHGITAENEQLAAMPVEKFLKKPWLADKDKVASSILPNGSKRI